MQTPTLAAAALLMMAAGSAATEAGCDRTTFRIALDVGHDRTHPGATSARGQTEFEFNLALSDLVLRKLHEAGFTASFRIGDTGAPITLASRPARAREAHAAVFISLHHDSVQKRYLSSWTYNGRVLPFSDDYHGYSIFVATSSPQATQNLLLATDLGRALRAQGLTPTLHHAAPIDGERRQLLNPDLGIYQFDQLAVLRGASTPALLLEAGVIVNRDEEQAIRSGAYHPKVAAALVDAIAKFCNARS